MSKQSITILALSVLAAGQVEVHRFVTAAGAQAGDGQNSLGVSEFPAAGGEMLTVNALGTAVVEAGAAIAAGERLQSDADGKAVPKTTGATTAVALQAAAAEGDLLEVFLIPN